MRARLSHTQCLCISLPLALVCLLVMIGMVCVTLAPPTRHSHTRPLVYMERNKPDHRSAERPVMIHLRCKNGVLLLPFTVGNGQRMEAVFDTGSENLIVAGSGCVGSDVCSSSNGYYDPMMTELKEGRQTTISYGTQRDIVKWYRETLKIDTVEYKGSMLSVLLERGEDDQEYVLNQETKTMIIDMASVGVVQTRTGSSNLNVFGFGRSAHPLSVRNAMLEQIDKVFTLIVYRTTGWLVLGKLMREEKHLDIPRIPMERDCYYKKYFCVALHDMQVVSRDGASHSCAHKPTYAIVDTGSNMMSVSTSLLSELKLHGIAPDRDDVSIRVSLGRRCDDESPCVECTYTTDDYCSYGHLNIRDNLPFNKVHSANVLILGTLFLKNSIIEVDCETHTIGWKQLSVAV